MRARHRRPAHGRSIGPEEIPDYSISYSRKEQDAGLLAKLARKAMVAFSSDVLESRCGELFTSGNCRSAGALPDEFRMRGLDCNRYAALPFLERAERQHNCEAGALASRDHAIITALGLQLDASTGCVAFATPADPAFVGCVSFTIEARNRYGRALVRVEIRIAPIPGPRVLYAARGAESAVDWMRCTLAPNADEDFVNALEAASTGDQHTLKQLIASQLREACGQMQEQMTMMARKATAAMKELRPGAKGHLAQGWGSAAEEADGAEERVDPGSQR